MPEMNTPPEPFTLPVITCPACGHGIDPHGTDPGGTCGVGYYDPEEGNLLCHCLWSPNDIAATVVADLRRKVEVVREEVLALYDATPVMSEEQRYWMQGGVMALNDILPLFDGED